MQGKVREGEIFFERLKLVFFNPHPRWGRAFKEKAGYVRLKSISFQPDAIISDIHKKRWRIHGNIIKRKRVDFQPQINQSPVFADYFDIIILDYQVFNSRKPHFYFSKMVLVQVCPNTFPTCAWKKATDCIFLFLMFLPVCPVFRLGFHSLSILL